jgi:hypothetical protein
MLPAPLAGIVAGDCFEGGAAEHGRNVDKDGAEQGAGGTLSAQGRVAGVLGGEPMTGVTA